MSRTDANNIHTRTLNCYQPISKELQGDAGVPANFWVSIASCVKNVLDALRIGEEKIVLLVNHE